MWMGCALEDPRPLAPPPPGRDQECAKTYEHSDADRSRPSIFRSNPQLGACRPFTFHHVGWDTSTQSYNQNQHPARNKNRCTLDCFKGDD